MTSGLIVAGIAASVFALTFIVAVLYVGAQ
jgi:hypothetical protein